MSNTRSPRDWAHVYAGLGWPVVPLKPRTKIPDVKKWPERATTDPAQLARLWFVGSQSGIAVHIEAARLLVIGPDNAERLAEFEARGLPPTAVAESQPGHRHYFYRAPAGCPHYRVCVSKQYDILSAGLATLPPSVHPDTGQPRRWLVSPEEIGALPEAPAWAVAMLEEASTRRRADLGDAAPAPTAAAGDDPPVPLDERGLALWRGETVLLTTDEHGADKVDRSRTLWHIGLALARAGLAARWIAAAVQERDEALGYHKYMRRPDAARRYAEIGANAAGEARLARPFLPMAAGDLCGERVTALEATIARHRETIAAQQRTIEEQREIILGMRRALANDALGSERQAGIALAFETAAMPEARTREMVDTSTGEVLDQAIPLRDARGFVRVYLGHGSEREDGRATAGLAGAMGASPHTASRQLKKLAAAGVIELDVRKEWVEGDIQTSTWVRWQRAEADKPAPVSRLLGALGEAQRPEEAKRHGGKREAGPTCPQCGGRHLKMVCETCGHESPLPTEQDAQSGDAGAASVPVTIGEQDAQSEIDRTLARRRRLRETRGVSVPIPVGCRNAARNNCTEPAGPDGYCQSCRMLGWGKQQEEPARPAAEAATPARCATPGCDRPAEYDNTPDGQHCRHHAYHWTAGVTRPLIAEGVGNAAD